MDNLIYIDQAVMTIFVLILFMLFLILLYIGGHTIKLLKENDRLNLKNEQLKRKLSCAEHKNYSKDFKLLDDNEIFEDIMEG